MKKVVSLLFAVTLLFSSVSGLALAQEESGAENGVELPQEAMSLEDESFEVQDELDFTSGQDEVNISDQEEINIDPKAVEYRFRRSWGGEGDQLFDPGAIAVDQDNNLIVADRNAERIVIINQSDRSVRTIGGAGEEPGKFWGLDDLALAPDGTIFTVESGNCRIQHFRRDGRLIKTWGSPGLEPGQFNNPELIVASKDGFIYVVDNNYAYKINRIQKFTYDGEYLLTWGEDGSGPGEIDGITDIAVDNKGFVYVADWGNNRIQKFDRDGNFVLAWAVDGIPYQITANKEGHLLVVDGYSQVLLFSSSGEFLGLIIPWNINQYFRSGLAVDSNNAIYTSSYTYDEVNKYSSKGILINKWGNREVSAGKLKTPYAAVFNSTGDLLVLGGNGLQEFSRYGSSKIKFGQWRDWEGAFNSAGDIVRDKDGKIYISDAGDEGNGRIQIFNQNGGFVRVFEIIEEEGTSYPGSIAIDSKGDIYVLVGERCQKYTNDGIFETSWYVGIGSIIYIDLVDNLYFIAHEIIQYDLEGNYVRSIAEGQQSYARGMLITPDGNFYIADYWGNRILILDSNGNFLNSIGSFGNLPGQLYRPSDVLVADNGDVYVADRDNNRIQVFSPQAIQPDGHSGLVQNGGFEKSPALMEWTTGGDLSVSRTSNRYQGNYGMRLGQPVAQTEQGQGEAWAYTNFYVDPNWSRPVLKFKYKMSVNDILDYSDFFVAVQDGVGLNHLETVLRDGYTPCNPGEAPAPGQDLGWRTVSFDLSKYKGQHIRVNFSNRNLWSESLGIWTDIDDVMVWDEGPLPYLGPYRTDLPLIYSRSCDLRAKGTSADENIIMRPLTPLGE